jgi:serine/threonine protein kinase
MPCVAGRFKAAPHETIDLPSGRYTIQAHPAAPHLPFSAEGKRAIVYNVKSSAGAAWALKVFKKKYQTPELLGSAVSLEKLASFPGMLAAKRSVIAPTDRAAVDCPDLCYATLMPWIPGRTWYDLLVSAAQAGQRRMAIYSLDVGLALSRRLLEITEELERIGAAHTDIAPGNVMLELQTGDVQLLDLEDFYLPAAQPPSAQNTGSAGYRHPTAEAGKTMWCREGDRYAVAVMAAEFLILSNPGLGVLASDTGFFAEDRNSQVGAQRFALARPFLESSAPEFARLFSMAWNSTTLEACPPIAQLRAALSRVTAAVSLAAQTSLPGSFTSPQIPGVAWDPPGARPLAQSAAAGTAASGAQFWSQSGTQSWDVPNPVPTNPAVLLVQPGRNRFHPGYWILIALAVLTIIGISVYAYNAHNAELERQRVYREAEEERRQAAEKQFEVNRRELADQHAEAQRQADQQAQALADQQAEARRLADQQAQTDSRREAQQREEDQRRRTAEQKAAADRKRAAEQQAEVDKFFRSLLPRNPAEQEQKAIADDVAQATRYENYLRQRAMEMAPNVIQVNFVNQCPGRTINVALNYLMPNDSKQWLTIGWWKMNPGEEVSPTMATTDRHIYFYAFSSDGGTIWDGRDDKNAYEASIVDNRFAYEGEPALEGKNSRKVKMRHWDAGTFGVHDIPLTCKSN